MGGGGVEVVWGRLDTKTLVSKATESPINLYMGKVMAPFLDCF